MATPTDEKRRPAAKTPRTCDSCTRLRARWFCAADDAFLCHVCDAAVHAANPLASRHRRLHVGTNMPAWHHGFSRKPRTPRAHHRLPPPLPAQSLVPELDTSADEGEDSQLLYRVVPVLDVHGEVPAQVDHDAKVKGEGSTGGVDFVGLLPTEMELAEFSADMDSLLGVDSFCMEGADSKVEVGDEEGEGLGFRFDFESPALTGEEEMMAVEVEQEVKRVALKLDYEAVMAEWEVIGASPWGDCRRPDCMGIWNGGGGGGAMGMGGYGGREARVSRYREKRRMRLFSKKIRYEVRKLNAEKRPRMKGRFVKRASSFTTMATGTVC